MQDVTKEEVKQIGIEKVKACVHNDKFRISLNPNRIENQSFINDYRIDNKATKTKKNDFRTMIIIY